MNHNLTQFEDEEQRHRMVEVFNFLGIDHLYDRFPSMVVVGTNGKGSICSYLAAALQKAGYHTGLFISPHLYREEERIQIDGEQIPTDEYQRLIKEAEERKPGVGLFLATLYAAIKWFEKNEIDIAVIEAGIGGKLDATCAFLPILTVCAKIDLDHTHILGNSLCEIAMQKAGIAKRAVPMVALPIEDDDAKKAFADVCAQHGAILYQLEPYHIARKNNTVSVWADQRGIADLHVPLRGAFQCDNAAAAAYALLLAREKGIQITDDQIRCGIAAAKHPGRLQVLPGDPMIILDGAHNPDAAKALAAEIPLIASGKKVVLLTAMMMDKDIAGTMKELMPVCSSIVITKVDEKRGADILEIAQCFSEQKMPVICETLPKKAFALAKNLAGKDGVVLVAGSLYLPGEIGIHEQEK